MRACGTRAELDHFGSVLTSTTQHDVEFRAEIGLDWVSSDEVTEVVVEAQECERVVGEAFQILNERILPGARNRIPRSTQEWSVLRIGPYYVVPIGNRRGEDPTIRIEQHMEVLIFFAEDLCFLGWFLG